ncbi:hypothetical protein D9758_018506 [Tetrapyrgos nigripes]|uniref:HAT C-terminal dimerisation domain-containing protein n=1 Tax=Tetrapyrgos nigripes TaxID=182062 RepID=A0A8H5C3K9_9AGAR|nr:hypothetical protein D9758_018506 [Tetrapyrgos nigripes]
MYLWSYPTHTAQTLLLDLEYDEEAGDDKSASALQSEGSDIEDIEDVNSDHNTCFDVPDEAVTQHQETGNDPAVLEDAPGQSETTEQPQPVLGESMGRRCPRRVITELFNRFDNLPSLTPPTAQTLRDELDKYLDSDPEAVEDVLAWWYGKKKTFPCLYRMALDYLTIPGALTTVTLFNKSNLTFHCQQQSTDVERHFSQGRLLLPYVCNRLKAQTTRSLMCLGQWSPLGMIHNDDIKAVVLLDEIPLEEGDEDGDIEMPEGWDRIDSDIEDGI